MALFYFGIGFLVGFTMEWRRYFMIFWGIVALGLFLYMLFISPEVSGINDPITTLDIMYILSGVLGSVLGMFFGGIYVQIKEQINKR